MKNITDLNTHGRLNNAGRWLRNAAVSVLTGLCMASTNVASATNWGSSIIATGTEALLRDISSWVMICSPIVGILACGYFFIRRGIADEQEGKQWTRRITTAIICTILGLLVGGLIRLIASYYGVTVA